MLWVHPQVGKFYLLEKIMLFWLIDKFIINENK